MKYLDELGGVDIRELAIHRAEASAIRACQKCGLLLAPGMKIGYIIKNAKKWEVDPEEPLGVRYWLLSRAAGKGLGKGSIRVFKDEAMN